MRGAFSEAFLAGDPRAETFLPRVFDRADARRAFVARARERTSAIVPAGSVAVVTGQQIGLFLGPLYTVYKAASAIACARALERETGVRCVPVFWLQTEDHDIEEIDHCHVLDSHGALVKLQVPSPPTRCSVAHVRLGDEVVRQLDRMESCVGPGEVVTFFRRHYRPDATFAQAFAAALHELFGDELVLVDPCAHDARAVHVKALNDAAELSQRLLARERALEAAGFEVQVKVRPGAPLSFFHPEGATGPRFRLVPHGDGFAFVGRDGQVSREAAQCGPFSTSALLRPIVQDTLLPTAAIIGGPGELNYYAQLAPLYEAFGVPMPMLVPRARFSLVDARTRERREKAAVARPRLSPDALEQNLLAAVDAQLSQVPQTDAGVADAVKITRGTIARAASRLAGRYRRTLETAEDVAAQRSARVQQVLMPDGQPQERVLGLPNFAARLGLRAFKDLVLANVDPWNPQLKELAL